MNMKRFWIAVVVVFLVAFAYEYVVHVVILTNQFYKSLTPALLLGEDSSFRSIKWLFYTGVIVAQLIFAFFFAYIYTRGVEGKSWLGEGSRYGLLVWGVAVVPENLGMYSWSRFPGNLLAWWIFYGLIECIILGWVCAAIYKKQ